MKACAATLVLAFCASNALAAPAQNDVFEKRDPVLPIAAKVGLKAGAQLGKELFFDDKRDVDAVEKRGPFVIPLAAKVGIKAGVLAGKKIFFDDKKRDVSDSKREALIEFNPTDDNPFNPFDDPGVIGKRDAQNALNDVIQWWTKEVSDDSPLNPFDDPGLPDKRNAEPQGGFKEGLNNVIQWWAKEVGDDSPLNPFDDPGLPGKRSAEAEPFIKDVLSKVIPQDKNDDTSFNPLDGKLDIFKQ